MKRSRLTKGFTLAEMLMSVLLLALVSVMATVMSSAVLGTTNTMQEIAQAEILGTEALENMQSRLRVALNIEIDETTGTITFDIDDANKGYTFGIGTETDGDSANVGKIVLGRRSPDGKLKGKPLFSGVSYGNLKVTKLSFAWKDKDTGEVVITVEISYGSQPLFNGSIGVRSLNSKRSAEGTPAGG